MRPFNEESACPKCGSAEVLTSYHRAGCPTCGRCHDIYSCKGPSTPHMVRHCRRCQHEWYEAPLDAGQVDAS